MFMLSIDDRDITIDRVLKSAPSSTKEGSLDLSDDGEYVEQVDEKNADEQRLRLAAVNEAMAILRSVEQYAYSVDRLMQIENLGGPRGGTHYGSVNTGRSPPRVQSRSTHFPFRRNITPTRSGGSTRPRFLHGPMMLERSTGTTYDEIAYGDRAIIATPLTPLTPLTARPNILTELSTPLPLEMLLCEETPLSGLSLSLSSTVARDNSRDDQRQADQSSNR